MEHRNPATRQRFRDLSRTLHNRVLEERSATEQAATIRNSLSGLSEADRVLLDQGRHYVVSDTREAIKRIMEGGEAAFRLRHEKYGF